MESEYNFYELTANSLELLSSSNRQTTQLRSVSLNNSLNDDQAAPEIEDRMDSIIFPTTTTNDLFENTARPRGLPSFNRFCAQLSPAPQDNSSDDAQAAPKIEDRVSSAMTATTKSNNGKLKGAWSMDLAIRTKSPYVEPPTTFPLFRKLAPELSNMIWKWAAVILPKSSARIFQVASEHLYEEYDLKGYTDQIAICLTRGMGTPSLLYTCIEARTVSRPDYVRWECVNTSGSSNPNSIPRVAFIHKSFDTIYFCGMADFSFIEVISASDCPRHLAAMTAQFASIENMALSWEMFHLMITDGNEINWLRHLSNLKTFTIVYRLREDDEKDRDFPPNHHLIDIPPNTLRASSGKIIMHWVQKCLEVFRAKYPEAKVPEFCLKQVLSGLRKDEEDEAGDGRFREILDEDYELEAERHFGTITVLS